MVDQTSLNSIQDLHRMKIEGIITDDEFAKAKSDLLAGVNKPASKPFGGLAQSQPIPVPPINDHMAWATMALKRYADFHGRSCRREYWMFQALLTSAIVVGWFVILIAVAADSQFLGMSTIILGALGLLAASVPLIAAQVRRMHDQGRSGLLVLLNLIPYVGWIIVLAFMLIEGTRGTNARGPDPRASIPQ